MLHNFLSRPLSFLGWTTAVLFWLDFHQTQSNLYKWFRMQRHDWSSTSQKEPMLHLSSSPCTGYQWQLASSSRHWCLHTERPQAQHPPTSTHYYESTSPPEVWDLLVSDALWYHHREAQNLWRYFTAKCRERIFVARKLINIMRERESPCLRANLPARARISFALTQNRTRALGYTLLSRRESART